MGLYDEVARHSLHMREHSFHLRAVTDAMREGQAALEKFTDNWLRFMALCDYISDFGATVQRDYHSDDSGALDRVGRATYLGIPIIASDLIPDGAVAWITDGRIYMPKFNRYGEPITFKQFPGGLRHTLGNQEAARARRRERKRAKLRWKSY